MKIVTKLDIESPASHVWHLLGERFADIGEWADSIEESSLDGHLDSGAIRTCELKSFGPASGTIKEEITHFDRDARALTYVVRSGLPGFMQFVENAWTIEPLSNERSRITSVATFDLAWWMLPVSFLLKMQLTKGLREFFANLEASVTVPDVATTPAE